MQYNYFNRWHQSHTLDISGIHCCIKFDKRTHFIIVFNAVKEEF